MGNKTLFNCLRSTKLIIFLPYVMTIFIYVIDNRAPKLWRAMLHYFSIQEYFIYVLFYLIIAIGQNVSWYSLIKLLQLVSNFQAGSAEDNARIRENAMVYIYGVAMGSLMELVGRSRFNLHGATSGNKANVGTLGLLYKKVSFIHINQY